MNLNFQIKMASAIYQVVESNRMYVDQIFSSEQDKCLEALVQLKNSVIGSNKQKSSVIEQGIVARLIRILSDDQSTPELLVETAVILGSLAKGTDDHVRSLVEAGVIPALLNGTRCVLDHHCAMNYKMVRYRPSSEEVVVQRLSNPRQRYVEACLRCLRTIFASPSAPIGVLYQDPIIVPHLIHLIPQSIYNQECITTIMTHCCQTVDQQNILCNNGAIQALAALLCSPIYRVQMPSLNCLAQMCHKNEKVSSVVATSSFGGKSVPDILVGLLARDKPNEMQLAASKCLTYICRAGAISAEDPKILYKTLSCLVRMCKKDKLSEERITAAETLAYLINVDTELQRVASISDHLIASLTDFLKYQPEPALVIDGSSGSASSAMNITQMKKIDHEIKIAQNIKQAAFKAFASLGANDEDIRKRIIDTDSLMDHIVSGLSDGDVNVRLTAVRCLHSLSRSVQQLRTTFQDHTVWKPLMQLLHGAQDDILIVASSTLCNLLLEFSPSKEPILESGAVDLLCSLTCRDDPSLRLNGIWALMNMAFQAEQKIKSQILNTLGTDQIFRLLSDSDVDVLMKTLGLLRNLLSTKPHIDHIMVLHGKQIMQAVILILEGDHAADVKEQALCILANIADGDSAKNFIMSNEDVLKKLATYMMHRNIKLQIAATFCISNLIWNEEDGALERQIKLKELGIQKLLQQMVHTSDTTLFDKVKTAMQQFANT